MTGDGDGDMLFGLPGAEHMYRTLADCYEAEVEPWADEFDRRPRPIEEWTAHPPLYHLATASTVLEWIIEAADEVDEGYAVETWTYRDNETVLAHINAALRALADLIVYRMAHKLVAEHVITWDDAGHPLVDGEPMYVKSKETKT